MKRTRNNGSFFSVMMNRIAIALLLCLACFSARASDTLLSCEVMPVSGDTVLLLPQEEYAQKHRIGKGRLRTLLKENRKTIAAVLAFPIPFGFFGGHRIYLGTKPYVPFVYIGTLGGCALVLPFIDFFTILLCDEETFKTFENNPRVFMWAK